MPHEGDRIINVRHHAYQLVKKYDEDFIKNLDVEADILRTWNDKALDVSTPMAL